MFNLPVCPSNTYKVWVAITVLKNGKIQKRWERWSGEAMIFASIEGKCGEFYAQELRALYPGPSSGPLGNEAGFGAPPLRPGTYEARGPDMRPRYVASEGGTELIPVYPGDETPVQVAAE